MRSRATSGAPSWERAQRRRRRRRLAGAALVVLTACGLWASAPYREAASLLARYEDGAAAGGRLMLRRHPVSLSSRTVRSASGGFPALAVEPTDVEDAPGILLVPGVHEAGLHEPRLVRYAQQLAGTGFVVLVPELFPSDGGRLDVAALERLRAAADLLAHVTGRSGVAAVGVSFGGGLALRAACEDDHRVDVALSIGGHHDLARVIRWYAGEPPTDDDVKLPPPSAYGGDALLRAHAPDALTGGGAGTREALRAVVAAEAPALALLSPAGQLASCDAPLFVVHGEGDDVIPWTEAAAVAAEQPRARVVRTPYLSHVDPDAGISLKDRWTVVALLADFLAAARAVPSSSSLPPS